MNTNHEIDSIGITGEVVVYFSDVLSKSYQLEQWLPVLEKLHKTHPVVLVFRSVPTMRHFRELTSLPKMYVRFLDDLVKLYDNSDFKVCLYVNNGVQNFQSLSSPRIVHVHINHGEATSFRWSRTRRRRTTRYLSPGQLPLSATGKYFSTLISVS